MEIRNEKTFQNLQKTKNRIFKNAVKQHTKTETAI